MWTLLLACIVLTALSNDECIAGCDCCLGWECYSKAHCRGVVAAYVLISLILICIFHCLCTCILCAICRYNVARSLQRRQPKVVEGQGVITSQDASS